MFTGLVQTTGTIVKRIQQGAAGKLIIQPAVPVKELETGESIAVNGACLTLESGKENLLQFHVMEESFRKTNLGELAIGASVNLERALTLKNRLGGHLVSGHVDCTGRILSFGRVGSDRELVLELPETIAGFMVPKGSICIDGVSLTVASLDLQKKRFAVRIIPVTWDETCLKERQVGDRVNLEADMLGKYVRFQLEQILSGNGLQDGGSIPGMGKKRDITMDDLRNAGF